MAKTYADSVKLPNLVAVAHPLNKYSPKCSLNIEGKNSLMENSFSSFASKSYDRKILISGLLDNDESKSKSLGERMHTNSDQL
ncbi:unnamed protein product [Brachionus calyciflorus]|uniref:Uncharacterized protein n=1 Tax=Brachionus calyciflorus TaxID=104777 RepID=A0A813M2E1_9BILA|nr:unnamed protein product [Brachionus calyciflorus]